MGPTLDNDEVTGANAILAAMDGAPLSWTAYALGTAWLETNHTLHPIKELGGQNYFFRRYDPQGQNPKIAKMLGNTEPGDGALDIEALRAAVAAQPGLAQLRALLLPSVRWHGYSVYGDDDADALVGRIEDAVGMLEARISDGDPELIGLIEEVIGEAESAIAEIHDSDDLYTAVQALHSIHRRACIALRPDGEALGRELLDRQLDDGWGFRADPLEDYAAALGEKGRAAYWRAVEAAACRARSRSRCRHCGTEAAG